MKRNQDVCFWVVLFVFCAAACQAAPKGQTRDNAHGDDSNIRRRVTRHTPGNAATAARATMKRSPHHGKRAPVSTKDMSGTMHVTVQKAVGDEEQGQRSIGKQQHSRSSVGLLDGENRRKRILDVILGEDCGAFGCGGSNTGPGDFGYGYTGNDYYPNTHTNNQPLGYWEECQDDANFECYYYYDDVFDDYYSF